MILLLSNEADVAVDKVCYWLNYYNVNYIRINSEESVDVLQKLIISNNKVVTLLKYNGEIIDIDAIKFTWFHRGLINLSNVQTKDKSLLSHWQEEKKIIIEYIYSVLLQKPHVGNPYRYNENKLFVLKHAVHSGLKIPNTIITNNKNDIISNDDYIYKPISEFYKYQDKDYTHVTEVQRLTNFKQLDDMHYTLFQTYLKSNVLFRVFIFFEIIYSACLITDSQSVEVKMGVDEKITMLPYNLPSNIKKSLFVLMKNLMQITGVVDLIYSNDVYYFLELNPVGIFDDMSVINNYNIEKEIAVKLKNISDE